MCNRSQKPVAGIWLIGVVRQQQREQLSGEPHRPQSVCWFLHVFVQVRVALGGMHGLHSNHPKDREHILTVAWL